MRIILTSIISVFLASTCAFAQSVNCGIPYAKVDRAALRNHLINTVEIPEHLVRIHALATLAQLDSFSAPQRMALNNEYQARLLDITLSGDTSVPGFKPRTNAWLNRIVDSQFLGLGNSNILTVKDAAVAVALTTEATKDYLSCF